jgi:hypothetical protein
MRAFLAVAVLLSLCALGPTAAHAATPRSLKDKKKVPKTGRIEISTNPGGYPMTIDGQEAGETTDYVRAIEIDPGPHTVEIVFPDDTRWSQSLNVIVGRKSCIALDYLPLTIVIPELPVSHCPYSVNLKAFASAHEGDIITFASEAMYDGDSKLVYSWKVSPPEARIVGGSGTPTITVDTTGLAGRRVTATLVVDDASGGRGCRQTVQATTEVLAPRKKAGALKLPDGLARPAPVEAARPGDPRPAQTTHDPDAGDTNDGGSFIVNSSYPFADADAPRRDVQDKRRGPAQSREVGTVVGILCHDCGDIPGAKKNRNAVVAIGSGLGKLLRGVSKKRKR